MIYKVIFVLMIFYANLHYTCNDWIKNRSPTLYDILNVTRSSNFEEIKVNKNLYLEKVKQKDDPAYEGDKLKLMNYTMTKTQLSDVFNILTNHHLKEAYDKHNLYYSEEDFTKKKAKNIPLYEKYVSAIKGLAGLAPYIIVIHMALGAN